MSYSSSTGGERLPRRGTRCRSLAHHNITPTPSPSFSGNIPASRVRNSRASIGAHTAIVPQTGRNIGCCTGFLGDLVPLSVGNGLQLPARSPRPGDFDRDLGTLLKSICAEQPCACLTTDDSTTEPRWTCRTRKPRHPRIISPQGKCTTQIHQECFWNCDIEENAGTGLGPSCAAFNFFQCLGCRLSCG